MTSREAFVWLEVTLSNVPEARLECRISDSKSMLPVLCAITSN